jgi:hypothetical protein
VELWASTNPPDNARQQLQDVRTWVGNGYIDSLNIQFYRTKDQFNQQWSSLQQQLASIPRIRSGQVPVSVALAAELPTQGVNIPPQEIQAQAQRVQSPNNPVRTYAVAFDDIRWRNKQQELRSQLHQTQKSQVTPEHVQAVIATAYESIRQFKRDEIAPRNFIQSSAYQIELTRDDNNQQLRIFDKAQRVEILSYQNSIPDFNNLASGQLRINEIMPNNVRDFQYLQQDLEHRVHLEDVIDIAERIVYRYGEQSVPGSLVDYHYEDATYRIVKDANGLQIFSQADGRQLLFAPITAWVRDRLPNTQDNLTPQAIADFQAMGAALKQAKEQEQLQASLQPQRLNNWAI